MKKIFSILFTALLIFSMSMPTFAQSLEEDLFARNFGPVVQAVDYTNVTPDIDEVIELAQKDIFVNDRYTKVDKTINEDGVEVITVTQLQSKEVYAKGAEKEQYVTMAVGSLIQNGEDGSKCVSATLTTKYDKLTFSGLVAYKITASSRKWNQIDSNFKVTKITGTAGQNGAGFNSNGTKTNVHEVLDFTTNNPTKGTTYTTNTGFTKYLYNGVAVSSITVTFSRVSGGTTWSFPVIANIIEL